MLTRNSSLIHGVVRASALPHAGCGAPVSDAHDESRTLAAEDAFAPSSIADGAIRVGGEVLTCNRDSLFARRVEERLLDLVRTQEDARQSVTDRESEARAAVIRNANAINRPPFSVCPRSASRKRDASDARGRA